MRIKTERFRFLAVATIVWFAAFSVPTIAEPTETDTEFFDSLRTELREDRDREQRSTGSTDQSTSGTTSTADTAAIRRSAMLGSARNAVATNDDQRARDAYSKLLIEFPEDVDSHWEYAGLLMRWAQWDTAEQQLRHLVTLAPQSGKYAIALADVLTQQQRTDEAIKLLEPRAADPQQPFEVKLRLARMLAWQQDFERSDAIAKSVGVDDLSANAIDLSAERAREIAAFQLESGHPEMTLKVLDQRVQGGPSANALSESAGELSLRVRALADLGRRSDAKMVIAQLVSKTWDDAMPLSDLADALYQSDHDQLALSLYTAAAQNGINNVALTEKTVRTQVRLLDLTAAADTLGSPSIDEPAKLQAARGNFLTVAGRHVEAEAIYRKLLEQHPDESDFRNGYGHLYYSIGDYLRAESEYRKSLALVPNSLKTIPYVARAMMQSRQYDGAITLLRNEMTDLRRTRALRPVLMEVLVEGGFYEEAEKTCREALADSRGPRQKCWCATELAWVLIHQTDHAEATEYLESSVAEHEMPSAKASYGLATVLRCNGMHAEADNVLANYEQLAGDDIAARTAMADLATSFCDGCLAERMLLPVHVKHPDNPFIVTRLGEAVSIDDRYKRTCRDRAFFRLALCQNENNTRAKLGLARSYARTQQASDSCCVYRDIVAELPTHRLAETELARVTYGAWGVDVGVAEYDAARQRVKHNSLIADNHGATSDDIASDDIASNDTTALATSTEHEYRDLTDELLRIEQCAKSLKPWRPRSSIDYYQPLLRLDRINEEAHFDLAQVYGSLNRTTDAARQFQHLLDVNPCHAEAEWALARTMLERGPQTWSSFSYDDQQGRNGLTDISRIRLDTIGRVPLWGVGRDEDEFAYAGYAHEFLRDAGDRRTNADALLLGISAKPWCDTRLFADLEVTQYDRGFSTRPTGRWGMQRRTPSDVVWTLAGLVENVAANGQSIDQDIFRTGFEANMSTALNWRWNVSAGYRAAWYSDDNFAHEANFTSDYLLRYGCGRCQWRALWDAYYFDFDNASQIVGTPGNLLGTIHPYFAPQGFAFTTLGLEYKRSLGRFTHKYANLWWWSAYAGGRVDSEGIGYAVARLRYHRDLEAWLSVGFEASAVSSEVYDAVSVSGYLIARRW